MAPAHDLVAEMNAAFERLARGLRLWPDPHENRPPSEDEYSVVTDAAKWRIIGARADAWLEVLETHGLAHVERDISVRWVEAPGTRVSRVDRAVSHVDGALPLVITRNRIGDIEDAGVTIGVGDPATRVSVIPGCGCDACDHGSRPELDEIDRVITSVVSGEFRHLDSSDRTITQLSADSWWAVGDYEDDEIDRILENSAGWSALSGRSWLP